MRRRGVKVKMGLSHTLRWRREVKDRFRSIQICVALSI